MDTKIYIFSLDYGKRSEEKMFIKDILRNFDEDTVVGCGIFVNNNPYALELLFYVSIEKDVARFEEFLMQKYSNKKRIFNYFIQRRMRNPDKPFIVVNFDVPHNELPPLVQDYKYIDFSESDAMEILVNSIKKRLNK